MSIEPYKPRGPLPYLFGDVPTFLGLPKSNLLSRSTVSPQAPADVVVFGAPWEGALTWGSYAGCTEAPNSIRRSSLRYGSWLPEHDVDFLDNLLVQDAGNVATDPANQDGSMERIALAARLIAEARATPIAIGGDHSITIPAVAGLEVRYSRLGVIVFDSHFDNAEEFHGNKLARCSVVRRIAEMSHVSPSNLVHVGIRGPRNGRSQAETAREMGATVFSALEVDQRGILEITRAALEIAGNGTDGIYLSLDTDVLDSAHNPGGPIEYGGMRASDLFGAVYEVAKAGIVGADIVEVYPGQDPVGHSSHLCAQLAVHLLCGISVNRAMLSARTQ